MKLSQHLIIVKTNLDNLKKKNFIYNNNQMFIIIIIIVY